jgi:glycosyltransferase involved in cell wall biosynthesis
MARRGWDVTLLATDGDGDTHLNVPLGTWVVRDGFRTKYFRTVRLPGRWNSFALSEEYRLTLRREVRQAAIVHTYSLYNYPSLWSCHYARKYAVPYVLEPHGTLDSFLFGRRKWRKRLYECVIERRDFRGAAAVRFLSQAEALMAQRNLGMPLKGGVIPSGIILEELQPSSRVRLVLERYGIPATSRLVAFVGRLDIKKGIDILIQSFIELAQSDDTLHLAVIGPDNGMERRVRVAVARAKMNCRVTITGMVTGQDKFDLMSAAAVIAIPSYTENFCNVAIEAMALGVPVVVSSGVGIAGQIEEAGAGVVVAPNADALKSAMERMLGEPEVLRRYGLAGRALAAGSFSWSAVGAKTDALYRELMRRQPGR